MASPTRSSLYVTARIFYSHLMRKHLNWSLKEIGASINRDHTTIIHSLRKYEIFISTEEVFRSLNKTIEEAIANRRCPIVYKIRTSSYEKYHSQILKVS
jgi:chromosomal replication initiation ATPase DnaA